MEENETANLAEHEAQGQEAETEQTTDLGDIEDRARRMGWVDEENYRGPRHRWVDAEEYVKRAEEELPVLRAQLRRFEERDVAAETRNQKLEKELGEIKTEFKEFHKFSRGAEERAYQRAKKDLEAQMDRSVEEADLDTYHQAKRKIAELDEDWSARAEAKQQPQPQQQIQQPGQPQISPAVQDWVSRNQWFERSPLLNGAMLETHDQVVKEMPWMTEAQQLEESTRRVMTTYPDRFPEMQATMQQHNQQQEAGNTRRNGSAAVASSSTSPRNRPKKDKTFDDLPDDAKQQYVKFASKIPGYTKEEYLKAYQWS